MATEHEETPYCQIFKYLAERHKKQEEEEWSEFQSAIPLPPPSTGIADFYFNTRSSDSETSKTDSDSDSSDNSHRDTFEDLDDYYDRVESDGNWWNSLAIPTAQTNSDDELLPEYEGPGWDDDDDEYRDSDEELRERFMTLQTYGDDYLGFEPTEQRIMQIKELEELFATTDSEPVVQTYDEKKEQVSRTWNSNQKWSNQSNNNLGLSGF